MCDTSFGPIRYGRTDAANTAREAIPGGGRGAACRRAALMRTVVIR